MKCGYYCIYWALEPLVENMHETNLHIFKIQMFLRHSIIHYFIGPFHNVPNLIPARIKSRVNFDLSSIRTAFYHSQKVNSTECCTVGKYKDWYLEKVLEKVSCMMLIKVDVRLTIIKPFHIRWKSDMYNHLKESKELNFFQVLERHTLQFSKFVRKSVTENRNDFW